MRSLSCTCVCHRQHRHACLAVTAVWLSRILPWPKQCCPKHRLGPFCFSFCLRSLRLVPGMTGRADASTAASLPHQVKDMTGGALTWVNEMWPGAWFGPQGVKYVCVAGRAVRGNREAQRSTVPGYR